MRWVFLVLSISVTLAAPALAATYVVNPDGTGDFPTIQAAVDASVDGDTIELGNGVFTGPGNRDVSYLGKAITIRSQGGPESCTIDCGGPSTYHHAFEFISGEGPEAVLEGVTIANGKHDYGGGVLCDGSSPVIRDCVFSNNTACAPYGTGGAILAGDEAYPSLIGCRFFNNVAFIYGGAVCICEGVAATTLITECTFEGNRSLYGGGVGI
jgi:predicted outer membrane repeat protein